MANEYDYIIVGAGSAGCALAYHLSRDSARKVLLLEAGGKDLHPMIHIPLGFAFLMKEPRVNWCYETEPEPELDNRRIAWPRGKVLGGSSSINGMVYIRGQQEDFDGWANAGCDGWSYDEVLPYFKRSEDNVRGASEYHGAGGPLYVGEVANRFDMSNLYVQAAASVGLPVNEDFNGERQEGVGFYQVHVRNGLRQSSAATFLKAGRHRSNLHIATKALATRVMMEGKRAVGVSYRQGSTIVSARARREVILCGGAINTPQLLELSGIGNPDILQRHGIPLVHALPGVGENLQDHLTVNVIQLLHGIKTFHQEVKPLNFVQNLLRFATKRDGLLAHPAAQVGVFLRTSPEVTRPDAQIHFTAAAGEYNDKGVLVTAPGTTATICFLRPSSRGSIHLRSSDAATYPEIRANYLSTQRDRERTVAAVKRARDIFASPVLAPYRLREALPGPGHETDEQILSFIRKHSESVYHPVGTCKMGVDDMSVVDPQLRVRGIEGLRIADASVMPTVTSGNTNATCVMIADKCADMILSDARKHGLI